jgi:hypothetical protein
MTQLPLLSRGKCRDTRAWGHNHECRSIKRKLMMLRRGKDTEIIENGFLW